MSAEQSPETLYVAIDGGGTASRAGLYDGQKNLLRETTGGPSNPVAYGVDEALSVMAGLTRDVLNGRPADDAVIAAGISGATRQRVALAQGLCERTGVKKSIVSNDLHPLLFANARLDPVLIVIAGTGSSAVAQDAAGRCVMTGGRGEVFGDEGSGYQVAVSALRAVCEALDIRAEQTALADALARAAGVDAFNDLVLWTRTAGKHAIADLAKTVCEYAKAGDGIALRCVEMQAKLFAAPAAAAARRLNLPPGTNVYLCGGLFEHCGLYRAVFETALRNEGVGGPIGLAPFRGHRAFLELAFAETMPANLPVAIHEPVLSVSTGLPTEAHGGGVPIDRMTLAELVSAMMKAPRTSTDAQERIAQAIRLAADAIMRGGRLMYMGAGTSGRLGVLDASECPPTFGVDDATVIGIMAGGDRALRDSIEGAEDDAELGAADVARFEPGDNDVVVGVTASGTTPYVQGGLREAKRRGTHTVLLCCNPSVRDGADVVIALDTGAELVAGSTRLKAGTATKLALNALSTGAMTLAGRVYDGYMVGVRPVNKKLRKRAARIIAALTQQDEVSAAELLVAAGDRIDVAVLMARQGLNRAEAEQRMERHRGHLRNALEEK